MFVDSMRASLVRRAFALLIAVLVSTAPAFGAAKAYVTNFGANTVSVIDLGTNTVIKTISPVGTLPIGVAVNGSFAYLTNNGSDTVSVIDTGTDTVIDTITVGTDPIGIALSPDETIPYVASFGSSNVRVIDTDPTARPSLLSSTRSLSDRGRSESRSHRTERSPI